MPTPLLLGAILIVTRLVMFSSYISMIPKLRSLVPHRKELKSQVTVSVPVSDPFDYGGTDAEESGTVEAPTSSHQAGETPGAWLPFIVISSNDDEFPLELTVAGSTYAVWRNPLDRDNAETKGYSIMLDQCPHRLAPLSQGRVDTITGCIECPYRKFPSLHEMTADTVLTGIRTNFTVFC